MGRKRDKNVMECLLLRNIYLFLFYFLIYARFRYEFLRSKAFAKKKIMGNS